MDAMQCLDCGKKVSSVTAKRCKSCANIHRAGTYKMTARSEKFSGKNSPFWKGGICMCEGYKLINMPNHPFAHKNKYVPEHRIVMEDYLGRQLKPQEIVHHINEDRLDNRIENLGLFPDMGLHISLHRQREQQ